MRTRMSMQVICLFQEGSEGKVELESEVKLRETAPASAMALEQSKQSIREETTQERVTPKGNECVQTSRVKQREERVHEQEQQEGERTWHSFGTCEGKKENPQQQSRYEQPPTQQSRREVSPPQQSRMEVPPPQQSRYEQPPPQQSRYEQPPPQQSRREVPPPQQSRWEVPPPRIPSVPANQATPPLPPLSPQEWMRGQSRQEARGDLEGPRRDMPPARSRREAPPPQEWNREQIPQMEKKEYVGLDWKRDPGTPEAPSGRSVRDDQTQDWRRNQGSRNEMVSQEGKGYKESQDGRRDMGMQDTRGNRVCPQGEQKSSEVKGGGPKGLEATGSQVPDVGGEDYIYMEEQTAQTDARRDQYGREDASGPPTMWGFQLPGAAKQPPHRY